MTEIEEKKQLIFQANKGDKGFYFASDAVAFRLENDAINYAKELKDDTVEYIKNPKYKVSDDETVIEESDEVKPPAVPKAKKPSKAKTPAKAKTSAPAVKKVEEEKEVSANHEGE